MRRREFITLLGGAAASWPLAARAQQPERMRRIGVLMGFPENDLEAQAYIAAFRDELQKLGWAEGRNGTAELIEIIANEKDDRIPVAARVRLTVRRFTASMPMARW